MSRLIAFREPEVRELLRQNSSEEDIRKPFESYYVWGAVYTSYHSEDRFL